MISPGATIAAVVLVLLVFIGAWCWAGNTSEELRAELADAKRRMEAMKVRFNEIYGAIGVPKPGSTTAEELSQKLSQTETYREANGSYIRRDPKPVLQFAGSGVGRVYACPFCDLHFFSSKKEDGSMILRGDCAVRLCRLGDRVSDCTVPGSHLHQECAGCRARFLRLVTSNLFDTVEEAEKAERQRKIAAEARKKEKASEAVKAEEDSETSLCRLQFFTHDDCDEADAKARARGSKIGAEHCHDECCEECFGN